jgi:hypothetical protein
MRIKASHIALSTILCLGGVTACVTGCGSSNKQPGGSGDTGGVTTATGGTGTGGISSLGGSGGSANPGTGGVIGTGGSTGAGGLGDTGTGGTVTTGSGGTSITGTGGSTGGATGAGGGGGNAATGGALGTGGGAAGGAGGCSAVFCEDFEKGSLDMTVWTLLAAGAANTAKVENTIVAHGSYSLQFHTAAGTSGGPLNFIMMDSVPAELTSHFYGRAYFNIGSAVQNSGHQMFTIAGAKMPNGFPNGPRLEVGASGGKWQLTAWANYNGGPGEDYGSGGTLPTGKWVCIEWEVQAGAPNNVITVWADGTLQATKTAKNFVPAFSQIGFGYYGYSNPPAFDMYVDDIVLDTKRVNCLP